MNEPPEDEPLFDAYAHEYDVALAEGISVSGEDRDFFARGRIAWLGGRLARLGVQPKTVLDFGCGTGSATPHLLGMPGVTSVIGVDVSSASISIARRQYASARARFLALSEYTPASQVDLVFCNGVFHHIPLSERSAALCLIRSSLRPGGLFAFWENNPWNPGTRLVMSRIPFDRDAVTLSPPQARRLLVGNGFDILGTDFQFIFPNLLGWLRPLEKPLCRLPLGAQYLALCRTK